MTESIDARIIILLDQLQIEQAHIAGRLLTDWRDLVVNYPDRVASLSLVAPTSLPAADLANTQERVQIFCSDLPLFGDWALAALDELPQATHHIFEGYKTNLWADLALDQSELIYQNLLAFAERHPATQITDTTIASGEMDGLTYQVSGQGEALILLPLGLSPSAWEPLTARLSQHFCVIVLGGAQLGFIPILEERGQSDGYLSLMRTFFEWIDLQSNESVLEVGCGTGVIVRWLVEETECQNPVTGMDLNNYLLTEAQSLAQTHGLSDALTFQQGNAESLPFDDNSFDVIFSTTVMEEVDAARMMTELIRVVKPGGRVGVVVRATDMAYNLNIPIPPEERDLFERQNRRPEGESCATATLYHYFQESPLIDIRFGPQLATFYNAFGVVERFVYGGTIAQMDELTAATWTDALRIADEDGTFYFVWPHHMAVGRKPK